MVKEYCTGTYVIDNEYSQIWCIEYPYADSLDYCYGGTRTVVPEMEDENVYDRISYLGVYESGLKNVLINDMIQDGTFDELAGRLPDGFLRSSVGGGRCLIQPKNESNLEAILNMDDDRNKEILASIFNDLGAFLNDKNGSLKLTPDFGRYAGLADLLHEHTNNVLGINCDDGGCGGKASYTSTGIIQAAESMGAKKDVPMTIIGAAGACGCGVVDYFINKGYGDLAVCDLYYDNSHGGGVETERLKAKGVKVLKSEDGKFTDECLSRGGIIIATTVGGEFLNSNNVAIKDGTILLLAHNECIHVCEEDYKAVDDLLSKRDITVVPGQLLTFGGALTSRIEWFYRENKTGEYFDKPLAHDAVKKASDAVMKKYCIDSARENLFRKIYDMAEDRMAIN